MSTSSWWAAHRAAFESALLAGLPGPSEAPEPLVAAMRHLLLPGGKRLRPAFALAGAEAVGGAAEHALPMAVAVELVHTYSLVHDDLPCMDDDEERRGRPTVHVAFDEATAVLAGDALLTQAFQVLSTAKAEPACVVAAVAELARAAGASGLVGGQVDDLDASGAGTDAETVLSVHARKSAALIAASVAGGACLAGAPEASLASLRRFGTNVGVAFQIADDLEDADEDEGCSLVSVVGASAARERAESLLAEALDALPTTGPETLPLRELAAYAVRRRE